MEASLVVEMLSDMNAHEILHCSGRPWHQVPFADGKKETLLIQKRTPRGPSRWESTTAVVVAAQRLMPRPAGVFQQEPTPDSDFSPTRAEVAWIFRQDE